jgi:hypothetical protein
MGEDFFLSQDALLMMARFTQRIGKPGFPEDALGADSEN